MNDEEEKQFIQKYEGNVSTNNIMEIHLRGYHDRL